MFNHHPNWCFFSVQSIFPAFLFHSSNPNSEGFFLKSHLDPVHVRSTITDPASQLRMPLTLPADWELQSPLLTYIVTEHSHWSHRSSSTSHWLSKIAPARLIGRKTELQLCKNSISINCWNNVMVTKLRNIRRGLSSVGHKFLSQKAEAHQVLDQ